MLKQKENAMPCVYSYIQIIEITEWGSFAIECSIIWDEIR